MFVSLLFLFSKFIQDKYPGYSQQAAAYIAGAVYDSSLVLSAAVGILIVSTFRLLALQFWGKIHWCHSLSQKIVYLTGSIILPVTQQRDSF